MKSAFVKICRNFQVDTYLQGKIRLKRVCLENSSNNVNNNININNNYYLSLFARHVIGKTLKIVSMHRRTFGQVKIDQSRYRAFLYLSKPSEIWSCHVGFISYAMSSYWYKNLTTCLIFLTQPEFVSHSFRNSSNS